MRTPRTLFIFLLLLLLSTFHNKVDAKRSNNKRNGAMNTLQASLSSTDIASCDGATRRWIFPDDFLRSALAEQESGNLQSAKNCLLFILNEDSEVGAAWTMLSTLEQNTDRSNIFLEEAKRSIGSHSPTVSSFQVLGPFQIGKAELDGDPVEEWGGIRNLRKNSSLYLPSELAPAGRVTWSSFPAHDGTVRVSFPIDWNRLIQTTSSMEVLEIQGWAIGSIFVSQPGFYAISCLGAVSFELGESRTMYAGDIYWSQRVWNRVFLDRGGISIYVRLRAKMQQQLSCQIRSIDDESKVWTFPPIFAPDVVDGEFFGGEEEGGLVAIPAINFLDLPLERVKLSIQSGRNSADVELAPQQPHWDRILPGQLGSIVVRLSTKQSSSSRAALTICSYSLDLRIYGDNFDTTVQIPIRCRTKKNQSFIFTFRDHDGVVSQAAAIEPPGGCKPSRKKSKKTRKNNNNNNNNSNDEDEACAVVMSLHGTGVKANDQADAYKVQLHDKSWRFGVEGAWVLAPTRHGAHNWEQTGLLSAFSAMNALAAASSKSSSFPCSSPFVSFFKNSPSPSLKTKKASKIIYAGHSMGGHGVWQLATHAPDGGIGAVSVAGWISKEGYGDSNSFFVKDIGISYVDPRLKAILEASFSENNSDLLASNIGGKPVLLRIGGADTTVPPYQQRRMFRILGENVKYSEIEGKDHWWWDTKESSDGGCVNDLEMRTYFGDTLQHDTSSHESFELIVLNPASQHGKGGIRVMQQFTPYTLSKVTVKISPSSIDYWNITTQNVRRLQLRRGFGLEKVDRIIVDGVEFNSKDLEKLVLEEEGTDIVRDRRKQSSSWQLSAKDENERSPANYGPMRQVAHAPFAIVYSDNETGELKADDFRNAALFLANLFYLSHDTTCIVVSQSEFVERPELANDRNLILVGRPSVSNILPESSHLIRIGPYQATIVNNDCIVEGTDLAALYTAPLSRNRLGLVIDVLTKKAMAAAMELARPTIPPMVRAPFANQMPDWIVASPQVSARGVGGIKAAGFWSNTWGFEERNSYVENGMC